MHAGLLLDFGGTVCFTVLQWANVVLMIQAEHTMANDGKKLWKFKEVCKDTVVVRPIYSFDNIQILPMQWLSPKALSICIGHIPISWLSEIVCRQHSDALPFFPGCSHGSLLAVANQQPQEAGQGAVQVAADRQ